jgi:hypothetical protein
MVSGKRCTELLANSAYIAGLYSLILIEQQVSLIPMEIVPVTQDTKVDIAQANPVHKNAQPGISK